MKHEQEVRRAYGHWGLLNWMAASVFAPNLLGLVACSTTDAAPQANEAKVASSRFLDYPDGAACLYRHVLAGDTMKVSLPDSSVYPESPLVTAVTPSTRPVLESRIRKAIMTWVGGIAGASTSPMISEADIIFTDEANAHVVVNWSATLWDAPYVASEPANKCWPVGGPGAVQLCGNVSDNTILHELGHSFCLGNAYGPNLSPGQEASVMQCNVTGLGNDDIAGVQANFCTIYPEKCNRRWSSQMGWCTGADAQLLAGDYNGDGREDLLCHSTNTGGKWIVYADEAGHFTANGWSSEMWWCWGAGAQLLTGDFNGDGRDDMLCHSTTTGGKWIAYADEAGHFTANNWSSEMGWCKGAGAQVLIGDFNGDGHDDMLCHTTTTGGKWIAYADEAGHFTANNWSSEMGWCTGVATQLLVGDFNGDGHDDLLCHDAASGNETVALADEAGQFSTLGPTSNLGATITSKVMVGKFNGDGRDDLVFHNLVTGSKVMAFAEPDGQFPGPSRSWFMDWCYASGDELLGGDFNGDRSHDMLCHDTSTGNVSVWINNSSAENDFNFDGHPDIVWYHPESGHLAIWYMDGSTRLWISALDETYFGIPANTGWSIVAMGDFTGDRQTDIMWRNDTIGAIHIWRMSGSGQQGVTSLDLSAVSLSDWITAGAGDFDGDGRTDVLFYNGFTGQTKIWYLNSALQIEEAFLDSSLNIESYTGWHIVGAGDFNGDGQSDIAWYRNEIGVLSIWYMNGTTRTGVADFSLAVDNRGYAVVGVNDYNADGKTDLMWHNDVTGHTRTSYLNESSTLQVVDFDGSLNVPFGTTGWRVAGH